MSFVAYIEKEDSMIIILLLQSEFLIDGSCVFDGVQIC